MKYHLPRFLLVLGVIVLALGFGATAYAQGGETIYITTPADGESVNGILTLTGAVDFPDFMKYEVFLKSGDQLLWASTVYAPVINGNLARFDTRIYPDGAYQLIIRMVRTDSNYTDFTGPTFLIENNLGAPQPYPEIEAGFLYPPVAGAVARIRNCSGDNLEFDYNSPQGYCSADNLWIPFKAEDSPTCPFVDVLLIPSCEYRGTAIGQGQPRGASYSFLAEPGKVYEITYPGGSRLFLGEVSGDERAATDTGGLAPDDPARLQPPPAVEEAAAKAEPAVVVATAAPAPAAPEAPAEAPAEAEPMLPVSGRGAEFNPAFVVVAGGLILLLVIGGIVAVRKRGYTA